MTLTAGEIMTKNVVTAKPEDNVTTVAKLLATHHVSAVPVCDASGAVVGLISEADLMRPLGTESISKRSWWLNLLADGTDLAPDFVDSIQVGKRGIADIMHTPVHTAPPETTIHDLADLFATHHVKRLPIVKDGKLVGIVSRADLIKAFAGMPDAVVEPI